MQLRVSESPPAAAALDPPLTRATAPMEISPEPLATPRELTVSPTRITQAHLSTRRSRHLLDSYVELGYQFGSGCARLLSAIEAVQPIYQLVQNNSEGDMDDPHEACWQPLRCKQRPWRSWQLYLRHRTLACAKNRSILDELQDSLYEQLPEAFMRKRSGQRPVCQMLLLLRTEPGHGSQEAHCDIESIGDGELSCSLATFLVPTLSTAFTSMSLKDTQRLYGREMSDAERWAMTASSNFFTLRMTPGMTQSWGGSTLHRQPTNTTGHMRVMVYSLWTFVQRPTLGVTAFYPRLHMAKPSDRATAIAARVMMQAVEAIDSNSDMDDEFVLEQQPPSSDEEISDDQSSSTSPSSPRKYFSQLHTSQRRKRRAATLAEVSDTLHSQRITRAELVAMLTPRIDPLHVLAERITRRGERKVRCALRKGGAPAVMPSEYSIRQVIKNMSENELALGDFRFINDVPCPGVYVLDPLRLISSVRPDWECATVLVDCGGGRTTVAITLHVATPNGRKAWDSTFLPSLVYHGKDNNDHLSAFAALTTSPFTGSSSAHLTLWSLLGSLHSDERPLFLCGDHNSIASVRAQLQCKAIHACSICTHHRDDPPGDIAEVRESTQCPDAPGRVADRQELLPVHGYRIVPPVLHVVLGLGNALVDRLEELSGMASAIRAAARGTSAPSGRQEFYQLNGNQLKRFVKHELQAIEDAYRADTRNVRSANVDQHAANIRRMCGWLRSMVELLWRYEEWTDDKLDELAELVDDMTQHWVAVTGLNSRPKLHMLAHCTSFIEMWGALAAFGETPIERYHAQTNQRLAARTNIDDPLKRLRAAVLDTLIPTAAAARLRNKASAAAST